MATLWILLLSLFVSALARHQKDVPCVWQSGSSTYDIRPLMKKQNEKSYVITDGDIPCTPEIEPSYTYTWNFCENVAHDSVPKACGLVGKSTAVAFQSIYVSDTSYDCYIIGHYDSKNDDLYYSLLDSNDPSKGVSMKYPSGESCKSGVMRSATIDVLCDNTKSIILSAQEPDPCSYHLVMKSYYGCPVQCPITSNGLCNSHGHCAYDPVANEPYCYCDSGYGGSDCHPVSSSVTSYDGFSVQLGLLITLLVVTIALIGVVIYFAWKVKKYREEQVTLDMMSASTHGLTEMTETVHF